MWEEFVIHTALGILRAVVSNSAKAATLEEYLLELADAIYDAYSIKPPPHK